LCRRKGRELIQKIDIIGGKFWSGKTVKSLIFVFGNIIVY